MCANTASHHLTPLKIAGGWGHGPGAQVMGLGFGVTVWWGIVGVFQQGCGFGVWGAEMQYTLCPVRVSVEVQYRLLG